MPEVPGYLSRSLQSQELGFGVGPAVGDFDEKNDPRFKMAEQTVELFTYQADALRDHFDQAEKYWKMYMLQRKDNFRPWEYWRNKVVTAHPNTTIEVSTAHLVSQVLSHQPPVKPESTVGVGREALQARMEEWFGYSFRKNHFERELELFVREMLVQGMAVRKNAFISKSREIVHFPSPQEAEEFELKLQNVIDQFGVEPPVPEQFPDKEKFQEAFEAFRQEVNASSDIGLPEFPVQGPRRIVHYIGAGWKRMSMFSFFYDPSVAIHEQQDMIISNVVDQSWVKRRSEGENAPFDPELVQVGLETENHTRTDVMDSYGRNQWEQRLSRIVSSTAMQDEKQNPKRKKPVHILEHYSPGSKVPYRVVLNGKVCINRRKTNPFQHGDFPVTIATNVNVPFNSSGVSDLRPAESIFRETNALRSLTLDGVKLSVLPIFSRIRESGLTDLAKFLVPGAILDAPRTRGAIEQVSKVTAPDTLGHLAELRTEIEDATGTYPQARGATGPGGITATQTERAFQGLAVRNQIKLHRLESDLSNLPSQWLSIAHQFIDAQGLSRLNQALIRDMTNQYTLEDFAQSIEMDWAFRSSRIVANKELQISNLKDLLTIGANTFAAMPVQPVSLERLFLAIAEKTDPEVAAVITKTPDEIATEQTDAVAAAEEEAAEAPEEV